MASTGRPIEKFGVQAAKARIIYCFRNGDKVHRGERLILNMKRFKTYDQLKQAMTTLVKPRTGAIRKVAAPSGHIIQDMDEFVDGGKYVCCGAEPLDKVQMSKFILEDPTPSASQSHQEAEEEAAEETEESTGASPAAASPQHNVEAATNAVAAVAISSPAAVAVPVPPPAAAAAAHEASEEVESGDSATVKKIEKFGVQTEKGRVMMCFRNGDKFHKGERMVFHPKKFKHLDQLFQSLTVLVKPRTGAVRKLVTPDGHIVKSFDDIVDGGSYICCGAEPMDKQQLPAVLTSPPH